MTPKDAERINQVLKEHAIRVEDRLDRLEGMAIATALAVRGMIVESHDRDRMLAATTAKFEEFLAHALPSTTSDALLGGFQIGRKRVLPSIEDLGKS